MNVNGVQAGRGGERYTHPEAYCLMKYATDDGTESEWIWNSRDGVTPFIVGSRTGRSMTHVDWHLDRRVPKYQPKPGERMFVDLTLGRARQLAEAKVELWWDDADYPMRERFPSKQEAVRVLTESMMLHPGQPDLVEAGGRVMATTTAD